MRKIKIGLILLSVVMSFTAIPLSLPITVSADSGKKPTPIILKVGDKVNFSKDLVGIYQGTDSVKNKPIWKSTLAAPIYNNEYSKIDCKWTYVGENSFYSNSNLFYAEIKDERVTINNGETVWSPTIELIYDNGKRIKAKYSYSSLIHDYINPNYMANVVRMEYIADGYTLYRDLRLIEGVLCEYYYLPSNPNADILVTQNVKGNASHFASPSAWDSNHSFIMVDSIDGSKRVSNKYLKDAKYPVIIDPSPVYYTGANDGFIQPMDKNTHDTAHDATTGYVSSSGISMTVGQRRSAFWNYCYRGFVYFDTSALPDDAVISSAKLGIYYFIDFTDASDFNVVVTNGQPTYPQDILSDGDYLYTHYSGNGGNISTIGWSSSSFGNITLNTTGVGWINKTGTTKLALFSNRDIDDTAPTGDEYIYLYTYEQGTGYRPYLEVTYTATAPTITTNAATSVGCNVSTLNGEITNTGGEANTLRGFIYGTTSNSTTPTSTQVPPAGYTSNWTEAGSFSTGTFSKALTGLTQGQTYYFRAFSKNSGGYSYGTDELTWTCWDNPSISTVMPTTITTSSARLQSYLNSMGGEACSVRFGWGTVDQGNNIAAYTYSSSVSGSYETGATPYLDITGLNALTTYYFNVQVYNSCGTSYGSSASFMTQSSVGNPTNVVVIPSVTSVVLTWTKGTGATNTVIRYSVNSCPTSNITGTLLYNDIASTYEHTGLTSGTDYCYWVTGYDVVAGYSAGSTTIHATTLAGTASSTLIGTPPMPTDTFRNPSPSSFETKNPIAPYLTNIATVMDFPIGNLWFVFAMFGIAFLAFLAFKITQGLEAPLVILILGFGIGGIMGIIPGLIAAFLVPIASAILIMKMRSNV